MAGRIGSILPPLPPADAGRIPAEAGLTRSRADSGLAPDATDVIGVRDTPTDGGRTRPVTDTLISTRRGCPDKASGSVTSSVASGLGAVRGRSNTWVRANNE